MPHSTIASYLSTLNEFITHWNEWNTVTAANNALPGGFKVADLQTMHDNLQTAITAVEVPRNLLQNTATARDLKKGPLLERLRQFRGRVIGSHSRGNGSHTRGTGSHTRGSGSHTRGTASHTRVNESHNCRNNSHPCGNASHSCGTVPQPRVIALWNAQLRFLPLPNLARAKLEPGDNPTMSTTMTGIDARGFLIGWANALLNMTSADIRAIPDDKWSATYGGCTKSAKDAVQETVGLLFWTAEALKGNVGNDYSGGTADCSTKDAALAALAASIEAFGAALGSASDEALLAEVTPPWQMPAPLFMIAQIAVSHIWYHDGQLNYIQMLLGDDKIHWMGD